MSIFGILSRQIDLEIKITIGVLLSIDCLAYVSLLSFFFISLLRSDYLYLCLKFFMLPTEGKAPANLLLKKKVEDFNLGE